MATVFDYLPDFWTADDLKRELDKAGSLLSYLTTRVKESQAPADVKASVYDFAVRYGEWAVLAEDAARVTSSTFAVNRYGNELKGWLVKIGELGNKLDGNYGIDLTLPPEEPEDSSVAFYLAVAGGLGLLAWAFTRD